MNFKVGDLVRCIDDDGVNNILLAGQFYIVREVNTDLDLICLQGHAGRYCHERFELAHSLVIKPGDFMISDEPIIFKQDTNRQMTLPTDSNDRKNYPLFRGCLRYFPAALAGIANISKLGNDKHNPGQDLHHARGKSMDHGDCIIRHLVDVEDLLAALERGDKVTQEQILNEVNQMAWRALAFSQELHERFGAPLAPGAKK
jgi:hypothetical protein